MKIALRSSDIFCFRINIDESAKKMSKCSLKCEFWGGGKFEGLDHGRFQRLDLRVQILAALSTLSSDFHSLHLRKEKKLLPPT